MMIDYRDPKALKRELKRLQRLDSWGQTERFLLRGLSKRRERLCRAYWAARKAAL